MSTAPHKAETQLASISPKTAQDIILSHIFYRHLGARPDMDEKIRAAFEKEFGRPMADMDPEEDSPPIYLEGPPGQGKTSLHKAAAKRFAKAMGMRFREHLTESQLTKIGQNDYVFTIVELGGETSNKEVAGLQAKKKGADGKDYMVHLPDWRLAATMKAGFAYVLFDDFPTATHLVQNATLGLLLESVAGDLNFAPQDDEDESLVRLKASTVHFGLAGNRGTRDGNKTFPITTAIATRVMRYDVEDTIGEWCERAMGKYQDPTGDAHMAAFVAQLDEGKFLNLAKQTNGMMGQSTVSRTLDMAMTQVRKVFKEYGGLANITKLNEDKMWEVQHKIEIAAKGCLESNTASDLGVFYNSLFLGAAPVAQDILYNGHVDLDLIELKYAKGKTSAGQAFGYALASALSAIAAEEIIKIVGREPTAKTMKALTDLESPVSKQLRQVFERFSYGVNQFTNLSMTTLASSKLMQRLATNVPALFEFDATYRVPKIDFVNVLAQGLFVDNTKHAKEENMEALGDSFSSWSANSESSFQNDIIAKIPGFKKP